MRKSSVGTGYSGTPLAKKLGIGPGCQVLALNAPPGYMTLLNPLPAGVTFGDKATSRTGLVHLFVVERSVLASELAALRTRLEAKTPVWVSWPKRAAKVPTTITEDTIREVALPLGYVDIKVCSVSDVWSGLKLVVRKELR